MACAVVHTPPAGRESTLTRPRTQLLRRVHGARGAMRVVSCVNPEAL